MSHYSNRTRKRQVSFRCTCAEEEAIDRKVQESGMSKTDYLIRTLSEHEIKIYPGLQEILVELKRQGVNLNQALRYAHNDKSKLPELREAIRNCNAFYSHCLRLWDEITTTPALQSGADSKEGREEK